MKKKTLNTKNRIREIITSLRKEYPLAKCDLSCKSAWELLVSTILSAQTTDKSVIEVTKTLFSKYPNINFFSKVTPEDLYGDIRRIGLARAKSKNIIAASKIIIKEYSGEVPNVIEELIKLPGVGRKTANVVLGNFYKIPSICVDTHVKRISYRLGLTKDVNPNKTELILQDLVPKDDWIDFTHLIIRLGRDKCKANKPNCESCCISCYCPKKNCYLNKSRKA